MSNWSAEFGSKMSAHKIHFGHVIPTKQSKHSFLIRSPYKKLAVQPYLCIPFRTITLSLSFLPLRTLISRHSYMGAFIDLTASSRACRDTDRTVQRSREAPSPKVVNKRVVNHLHSARAPYGVLQRKLRD
uniref:Uncharacterized protein n=1 Tax=Steinernema glaseri TaxID=37863 RepID=A0A1I7YQ23_9BILA